VEGEGEVLEMMTNDVVTPTREAADRRRAVRFVGAAVCGVLAVLYVALLFLVADAESGASENTYGAYLFLTIPYVIGAVLLVSTDRRSLWILGALVQVAVLVLFVMFGAGAFGPDQGVFDYEELSGLHMGIWATATTGLEVVLLGLLAWLAWGARRRVGAHRVTGR
jgi:hypothetical protein